MLYGILLGASNWNWICSSRLEKCVFLRAVRAAIRRIVSLASYFLGNEEVFIQSFVWFELGIDLVYTGQWGWRLANTLKFQLVGLTSLFLNINFWVFNVSISHWFGAYHLNMRKALLDSHAVNQTYAALDMLLEARSFFCTWTLSRLLVTQWQYFGFLGAFLLLIRLLIPRLLTKIRDVAI